MAHDVFISYSARDKSIADAVCATLEARKIRCWIAPRDVLPGTPYGEALIDGLNRSRVVVLVFSASSNESSQVMREVERAVTKGIPIIPLRIENVIPSKSLEYFVSSSHWLDALTPPLERHLQKLADSVQILLGSSEQSTKSELELITVTPTPKVKFWNKVKAVYLAIGMSAVIIILIIVIVFVVTGGKNNKALPIVLSNTTTGAIATPSKSPTTKSVTPNTTAYTITTTKLTTISTTKLTTIPSMTNLSMRLLFEDDFSNPDSGWQVRLDDVVEWGYENSEYSCLMKKQGWITWECNDNVGQLTDFSLEVDAMQISGPNENMAAYGVIFRALDSNNFYNFRISPNGRYTIEKRTNGQWDTPLRDWTVSNLIKQGSLMNHIKVVCKGSQIELNVNGYHLTTVTDNSYTSGTIGMTVGSSDVQNHIHFDNVKIFSIDS
jgi:hypothetical protein